MEQFDEIANEWNEYRQQPSSCLKLFLPLLPKRAVVLDAGCGNGRNAKEIIRNARRVVGLDSSAKMLSYARGRLGSFDGVELVCGDICALPFPDASFDACFYLASLHHLRKKDHAKAFKEMNRVLKKGGLSFVSVWNRWQKKFEGKGKEASVPWKKKDGSIVQRFYYLFDASELVALAESNGFSVAQAFYEKNGLLHVKEGAANLCAVFEKQ